MEIATVDLYRYEVPLTTPLRMTGSTVQRRRGLLVRFATEQGTIGWGDAAPLPGFSAHSLPEVVAVARRHAPLWTGTTIPHSEGTLDPSLRTLSCGPECPASLRFAAESAVVELVAATRGASVPAVLGDPRSTVALNALLTRSEDDGPARAARYREQGYRAVKVKVGHGPVEEEIELLRAIRRSLGDAVTLRADANRAWSLEEAVAFAEATRDLPIAYVEEPLADPTQCSDLGTQTDLPVALDETTREVGPDALRDAPAVSAVVLKPTLLGGVRRTLEWRQAAREAGVSSVISAAYESGVGLRMLAALAATGPDTPVGLSTYDRLADDVLRSPLPMDGPSIDVRSVVGAPIAVDKDRLERIDVYSS